MIRPYTTKRGTKRWLARIGRNGPAKSFPTRQLAVEWEAKQIAERRRSRAGLEVEREAITYDQLCELFLAGYTARSKDWTITMLRRSREKFGKEWVRSLRPEAIGAWLHGLDLSEKTKSHILERMRLVLNQGVEWGYLSKSPVRRSAVRSPGQRRVEPIMPFESWAEVCAVAKAAGPHGALIRFACATGLRPGEWRVLTWGDVDFDTKLLTVPGTKNENAERTIPLNGLAMEALNDLPRGLPHIELFPILDYAGWRRHKWSAALGKAGLDKRPPGQMRHTFATLALSAGVTIDTVSKVMGHSSIEITLRYYAKYIPKAAAEQLARMDGLKGQTDEGTRHSVQRSTHRR